MFDHWKELISEKDYNELNQFITSTIDNIALKHQFLIICGESDIERTRSCNEITELIGTKNTTITNRFTRVDKFWRKAYYSKLIVLSDS
jgi:hypothetical protein